MTCNNVNFDATVFAQNCILFVYCAILYFIGVYVCMHLRMRVSCMFIVYAPSPCVLLCIANFDCCTGLHVA